MAQGVDGGKSSADMLQTEISQVLAGHGGSGRLGAGLELLSVGQANLRLEVKAQAIRAHSLDSKIEAVRVAVAAQAQESERQTRWMRVVHTELEALLKRMPVPAE